jgi:hypothetical protein
MMKALAYILAASCLTAATAAFAQTDTVPRPYKWPASTQVQTVKINYAMPISCDQNIRRSADAINALGTKMQLIGATQNYTSTYYQPRQDYGYVNIQDASGLDYQTIMRTSIAWSGSTYPYRIDDTIVSVNYSRLYYGYESNSQSDDLACYTVTASNIGTQIDFESAMIHEFGHVMGMDHRTGSYYGDCVMHTWLQPSQIRRTFCNDEKQLMISTYGSR